MPSADGGVIRRPERPLWEKEILNINIGDVHVGDHNAPLMPISRNLATPTRERQTQPLVMTSLPVALALLLYIMITMIMIVVVAAAAICDYTLAVC